MPNIEKRTGARSDLDAYFVCIAHNHTPRLLQHLRAHKIKFTVDVEPEPPEDQADDDIFWFEHSADIGSIQKLIHEICKTP
jgi:hypothetical protein